MNFPALDFTNLPSRWKPKKVATVLGVSVKTLARWRRSGSGPIYEYQGGRIHYPVTELKSWLAENRKTLTSS